MLRECDYGLWAGKKFREVVKDEPDADNSWLHDAVEPGHFA
jgi:broad specificity phosphatase PhoE